MFSKNEFGRSLAFLAAILFVFGTPARAGGTGWVLTQRSKELGDQYVYLCASGVKLVNPRQGFGLVAKAPSWDVSFYNDRTKLYYALTFESWRRKLAGRKNAPGTISWRRSEAGNIAGLKATKFVTSNPNPRSGNKGWVSADCWMADQIKVPPRLAELLTTAYGMPTTQAVPLRVTYKNARGVEENVLDTYQQQTTNIPDSYLTAPGGYQLAKSEVEVMMTEENKQLVDDIAHDLGEERPSLSATRSHASLSTVSVPDKGVTLPNGQNISKEDIGKYIDAYKQYRQNQQNANR